MKKISISLITFLLLAPWGSWAAHVLQVKNGKALVDLEGDSFAEGEEFFTVDSETQKRNALVRIKQVKNGKAIAEVLKGTPTAGANLTPRSGSAAPRPMSAEVSDEPPPASSKKNTKGFLKTLKNSWGVSGDMLMSTMNASFTRTTGTGSSTMKGTNFGASAFYNTLFTPNLTGYFEAGLQQFNVSGTTALDGGCDGSTSCSVKINYLALYGMGRYYITTSQIRTWVGVGGGYLYAISKSSTVLNTSQITANQVFVFAGGGEYQLSKKNYIPFGLQYDLFPSSASVQANSISARVGYGWNL